MCLALALAKINLSLSVDVALTGDPLRRHSSCLCGLPLFASNIRIRARSDELVVFEYDLLVCQETVELTGKNET